MKFPVWRTTLEVFEFLWRERGAVVRFGWLPVLLLFLIGVALEIMLGEAQWEQITTQLINFVAQGIVLLPVTVMWYRLTVLGESELAGRPLLSFSVREWRLLGWQVLILVIAIAISTVCGAVTMIVNEYNQEQESVAVLTVNMAWSIGWLVSLLLLLTRLSMVLVLAALDQPVSLKTAWRITAGMSWRLLGATILIVLASLVVIALFKLVGFVLGAITALVTSTTLGEILAALDILGKTIGSLISLLGLATLFGFVYKMLTNTAAAQTQKTPPEIPAAS